MVFFQLIQQFTALQMLNWSLFPGLHYKIDTLLGQLQSIAMGDSPGQ